MKFKFINFQIDKLKKISGIKTIKDPIRNICITYSDGYQETFFIDGSIQKKFLNGIITLNYEDGTKMEGEWINGSKEGIFIETTNDKKIQKFYENNKFIKYIE